MFALVKTAEKAPFRNQGHSCNHKRAQGQCQPESRGTAPQDLVQRESGKGPDHVKRPMGNVRNSKDPKDKAQPRTHNEKNHCPAEADKEMDAQRRQRDVLQEIHGVAVFRGKPARWRSTALQAWLQALIRPLLPSCLLNVLARGHYFVAGQGLNFRTDGHTVFGGDLGYAQVHGKLDLVVTGPHFQRTHRAVNG